MKVLIKIRSRIGNLGRIHFFQIRFSPNANLTELFGFLNLTEFVKIVSLFEFGNTEFDRTWPNLKPNFLVSYHGNV
jgi:hypothetical protein